ncbi:MAG: NAD-dependent epimerase/dehydratase family protein [Acidimicrobiales bacterium]
MRVLVMGGTNFNGLALVHELVRRDHDVTVLNRGRSEADIPSSVHRLVGDRTDPASIRAALAGTEWDVVHDVTAYHPDDVALMVELLTDRVGHYVFASSTVTYAATDLLPITEAHPDDRTSAQNEYGLHKLLCEDLIWAAHRERGFPATSVAFSMVFGPHNMITAREQAMFRRLVDRRPILVPGDGTTLLQVGHVDDQAEALCELMGRAVTFGRRYNLTGREYVTRNGYVAGLAAAAGIDAPDVRHIPAERMDALWDGDVLVDLGASTGMGLATRSTSSGGAAPNRSPGRQRFQLGQLVQHLAPNIHRWNHSTVFSIDRLRADIGWEPRHTFASMAEHTFDWWRDSGLAGGPVDWTFEDQILAASS